MLALQSCASPVNRLNQLARVHGFERSSIAAGGFDLLVYKNTSALNSNKAAHSTIDQSPLHVYLEGDGSPWWLRVITMPDPTPRQPLMLRLMSLDQHPAVYLGRPCYNGTANEPPCNASLWTSGRYSPAVIDSMASALRVLARRYKGRELWLFGHSGGGTLAMLLAESVPQVSRVVTVAGNLDTGAWTLHHGYTPLYSSLNPARREPLPESVWQWHLIGGGDANIPASLVRPFIMRQSQASGFVFDRFNHGCCWTHVWPQVLRALGTDTPERIPARQFKYRVDVLDASGSQ